MVVALTTVTPVAAVPPRVTAVAPVKLVPVMVTEVPPCVGPLVGAIAVTVGTSDAAQFPMAPLGRAPPGWPDAVAWMAASKNAAASSRTECWRNRLQEDRNIRFSFQRKMAIVARLLRGELLE
jgi:hypothetical protein